MAQIVEHGGVCCGRRHMYSMNGATTESIISDMYRYDLIGEPDDINKITEIVVSEENDNLAYLREQIVGAGFVLAASWENDSGSHCYMYLHANEWTAFPNGAPRRVEVPAPAPAPRVVGSTFHNVYRTSGRSEAGWMTRERAAQQRGVTVRIDRRDVYASGAVRWTEGV